MCAAPKRARIEFRLAGRSSTASISMPPKGRPDLQGPVQRIARVCDIMSDGPATGFLSQSICLDGDPFKKRALGPRRPYFRRVVKCCLMRCLVAPLRTRWSTARPGRRSRLRRPRLSACRYHVRVNQDQPPMGGSIRMGQHIRPREMRRSCQNMQRANPRQFVPRSSRKASCSLSYGTVVDIVCDVPELGSARTPSPDDFVFSESQHWAGTQEQARAG